jgi:hypothetical protein
MIAVKAPANFSKLAAEDPLHPEIQRFLNAALAAANDAREPVVHRVRSSKQKSAPKQPRSRGGRST